MIPIFLGHVLPQKRHLYPFSVATYDGGIVGPGAASTSATVAGAVVIVGGGPGGVAIMFATATMHKKRVSKEMELWR